MIQPKPNNGGHGLRILVVDDEPDIPDLFRQRLRRELRKGDVDLVFAPDGAAALEILSRDDPPDFLLVFSDINMPVMDGLTLLQRVKQAWPGLRVVMVSAYSDPANRDRALALGADDFIGKPVDFQHLRDLIATFARRQEPQEE